ncbi:MAG TPA: hypothetical protein VF815_24785 [Myxococcaceae bacterium]|jgi:hypothetical protein
MGLGGGVRRCDKHNWHQEQAGAAPTDENGESDASDDYDRTQQHFLLVTFQPIDSAISIMKLWGFLGLSLKLLATGVTLSGALIHAERL